MRLTDNVTGIQHIGIPTNDIAKTAAFFESLGFEKAWSVHDEVRNVMFLKLKNIVIETYENGGATMKPGAIDHISLDVADIEEAWREVTALGYEPLEGTIRELPFWSSGVRFFTICGPEMEKVEFNQLL